MNAAAPPPRLVVRPAAVAQILRDRGVTRAQLAQRLGVDRAHLITVLRGGRPLTEDLWHTVAAELETVPTTGQPTRVWKDAFAGWTVDLGPLTGPVLAVTAAARRWLETLDGTDPDAHDDAVDQLEAALDHLTWAETEADVDPDVLTDAGRAAYTKIRKAAS